LPDIMRSQNTAGGGKWATKRAGTACACSPSLHELNPENPPQPLRRGIGAAGTLTQGFPPREG
jgi:hypothetical protein